MAAVPTTFGKYFLAEKLATGGMAEIHLAKLLGPGGFEKQLIIKQIHPELSGRRQFVELFVDEAKTLVSLSHGNIVPIYELGVINNTYFIAMEYIDGPTLDELMRALENRDRVMEPALATYIASELLKGLDYAHRKGDGLIHRDLSPRNVMISREGEVKLVDFGLAVTVDGSRPKRGEGGRPVGSFPYMSPEQVRGEPLDAQSDVFSAGVLLFEMLTARRLFARATEDETLSAVTDGTIPAPSSAIPSLSPELDSLCARALARVKTERFATAGEFLAAVNRQLYSSEILVTPETLSRLVAETCPPVGRAPTEAVAAEESSQSGDSATQPGLEYTRPMARGKRRADTVQTFATNAQFEEVLAQHEIPGDPEAPPGPSASAGHGDARDAALLGVADGPVLAPPRVTRWVIAAIAVIAGAAIAVISLRSQPVSGPAARRADAGVLASSPPLVDPRADPADAAPQPIDGSAATDASMTVGTTDAPDARPPTRRRADAASRAPVGRGTLVVGASPRGDVYLDGQLLGEAPGRWTVSAGKHRVEVRYKTDRRRYSIVVEPSQRAEVFASFDSPR